MKIFNIQSSKHVVLAAVAAVSLAGAVAAHADQAVDVPARTVRYADLNIHTQAGVAALYNRIRNAARQVCGDVDSRRLDEAAAAKACVDHAVFASVAAVDNPKLTREYEVRANGAQKRIDLASSR